MLFVSGVDLFFVLSGFLIGGLLLDSKDQPHFFKKFWIRRVARIFPVAYLVLAAYLAALFITGHFGITRFDNWLLRANPAPLWTYVTFTQNVPMALAGGFEGSGPRWMLPTWSLAIEEQFYLLFPFAVYFLRRKWLVGLVVCGIIAGPLLRDVMQRAFGDWWPGYLLFPTRMDGLLFGVALALIVRNSRALHIAMRYRLVLDVAALLVLYSTVTNWVFPWWIGGAGGYMYPLKQTFLSFMWAVMILRVFTYERSLFNKIWLNSILTRLGLISYGVYMYHEIINGLMHGLLFNQEPLIKTPEHLLAGIGVVAITIALATVSFVYLERPIQRGGAALARRLCRDSDAPRNVAPAVAWQVNLLRRS